ncbi:MAG TPA: protease inhibitor [Rhizobiales bacterium]|nr:protease inhibitor [Hyphomicrobiales bacterium]
MIGLRKPAARRATGLIAGLLVLSSCTVVVEEGRPPRPDRPGPVCTREYDPVCAERFGERQTFSNACLAESAGFRIVRYGECRRRPNEPRPEDGTFCPKIYDPVCARRGPEFKTFGNECLADAAGYRVIQNGPC